MDAQTFLIPAFSYDGQAPDAHFWVGKGNRPGPEGNFVADENGSDEPLRKYHKKTLVIVLPGDLTVFDLGELNAWYIPIPIHCLFSVKHIQDDYEGKGHSISTNSRLAVRLVHRIFRRLRTHSVRSLKGSGWTNSYHIFASRVPKNLNVPPSLRMLGIEPQTKLNCEVLDASIGYEVRWAIAGKSIVTQLVAKLQHGEYMAFGLSGDDRRTKER